MSFFEAKVIFPTNFVSILSAIKHNSSVLSKLKHYLLLSKAAHEGVNCWDFRVLGLKFVNFLMSTLSWQVDSFSIFASFFNVIAHNSHVSFKLIYFLLCIKGPNEGPNFETFVCTVENFPNFSCHFPNNKSIFPQVLHHTLVLWNITHLYFFSSNITYFGQKQPIKV